MGFGRGAKQYPRRSRGAASAALLEDESRFIDFATSPLWLAIDLPQVNPPGPEPIATPVPAGSNSCSPCDYWTAWASRTGSATGGRNMAPLFAAAPPLRHRPLPAGASHPPPPRSLAPGKSRHPNSAYDGHAEVWLDRGHLPSSPEARESSHRAIEDESKFIDFKRSAMWFGKELVFIDRREWN